MKRNDSIQHDTQQRAPKMEGKAMSPGKVGGRFAPVHDSAGWALEWDRSALENVQRLRRLRRHSEFMR